mmetsp:Transcript_46086/g.116667  ORF Transcript_46086/g.116667 Transcript_46086/m.116667 type:complete len:206 (-) Transcript_46086:782-1399(-)
MPLMYTALYPAMPDSKMYMPMHVLSRAPREAGERNPSAANRMVTSAHSRIWMPVPTCTQRCMAAGGARNTSPMTSFQPNSSLNSASVSPTISSYFMRSRRTVRSRMIITTPVSTSATTRELMMENQCTWPRGILRYASQREAHLVSDTCQTTSYVYVMEAPSSIFKPVPSMTPLFTESMQTMLAPARLPGEALSLHARTSNPTTV